MLDWSVTFLMIGLVAGVFGFLGAAASALGLAKILFSVFLLCFVLSLLTPIARA